MSDNRVGRPLKDPSERLVPVPMRLEQSLFDAICAKIGTTIPLAVELRRLVRKALAAEGFRT